MRDLGSISGKGLGVVCYFMRDFVRDFLGKCVIMQDEARHGRN